VNAPGGSPPRLGILVPSRDEVEVIGRRLANLARCRWPAGVPHRIVVVDDHSTDATIARAEATAVRTFDPGRGVSVSVVRNDVRPGKPGAIQAGLAALEGRVDVVVLTDADVVLEPAALEALARAFGDDPRLAMACGRQRFVRDLAQDGSLRSAALGPLEDASEPFDRWTARARRLESRSGRLFSVHGQLLAWRASLRLQPRPGIAADDLDLVLQVRARTGQPRRVELVREAVFCEAKVPPGPSRRAQALRRARAYVQLVRSGGPPAADAVSRAQTLLYRRVPLAAPALTVLVPLVATAGAALSLGSGAAVLVALAFLLALTSPPGWGWVKLALLIREAKRREREGALPERWEMARR